MKLSIYKSCSFLQFWTFMIHSIVTFILCFIFIETISCGNWNGIFIIDSSIEICEPNEPFMFNQKRSILCVKCDLTQIGVGTLGNNQVDLYLNQNRFS